jgi:hypothetical protein
MANKRTTKLVDFHAGRHGVFVEKIYTNEDGTEIAPDPNADADNVCKVKFYEEVDINKSPVRWIKSLFGMVDPVVTSSKFPDEAVYTMTLDPTTKGKPREVCVIEEDQYGEQPFFDKLDQKHEKQISKVQKDRKRARGDADMERLGNYGEREKENEDKDYQKRGGRRNPELDNFGVEERY